jgi:hypothetical protein
MVIIMIILSDLNINVTPAAELSVTAAKILLATEILK